MMVISFLVFGGALALALYAMAATVMPQAARIAALLYPRAYSARPLRAPQRRVLVRRWTAAAATARWRAAA